MNPESSHMLSESFFQEILTVYNNFSAANEQLTIKFSEDISAIITRMLVHLQDLEDECQNSNSILEGIHLVCHYVKAYEQALQPYLSDEDSHQSEQQ